MRAIDSSSLAKYVNKEQDWEEIAKQLASDRCSTLEFAMQEVGNSIWKRVLRKEVPKENALSVFQEFVRAVLDDGIVDLVRLEADLLYASLKLAVEERITIYDSAFIELARRNKWGLITSDDKQRDISKKCYATIHVTYIK